MSLAYLKITIINYPFIMVLGVDVLRLPKDTTLAEIGLDSLLALEVKHVIERHLNVTMATHDIRKMTVQQIIDLNN